MSKYINTHAQPNTGQRLDVNAYELYYEILGEGEPLLLLHGFGGCVKNWYPFIEQLAKQYRLILLDLPGHGYSSNPENTFSHKVTGKLVLDFMDKLGLTGFSAMGMSTGGMVLMHMASLQTNRIKAVVLISATTHFPEQAKQIMRRMSYETMPMDVKEMYQDCAKNGEKQIKRLIIQFNAFHSDKDDMNFSANDLSKITSPCLIVHGDKDIFFPIEIPQKIQHNMPNAELWVINGGEHVPIFSDPSAFCKRALQFLNNQII